MPTLDFFLEWSHEKFLNFSYKVSHYKLWCHDVCAIAMMHAHCIIFGDIDHGSFIAYTQHRHGKKNYPLCHRTWQIHCLHHGNSFASYKSMQFFLLSIIGKFWLIQNMAVSIDRSWQFLFDLWWKLWTQESMVNTDFGKFECVLAVSRHNL